MPRGRNKHGGYRKPRDPAAYSGPGKYSRRTDGGPQELLNQDQKTPEVETDMDIPVLPPMPKYDGVPALPLPPAFKPLGMGSQRPDELETEGSPWGYGSFKRPPWTPFDDEDL